MHEDLLGYLLGALEPHEMRRVARLLEESAEARRELGAIEKSLRPLEESYEPPEPPSQDLVARTLAALPPMPGLADDALEGAGQENTAQENTFQENDLEGLRDLPKLEPAVENTADVGYGWTDWLGAVAAAIVMVAVIMPALAAGRLEARKTACQDRLRQFGTAITQYVNHSPQERMPAVAETGREAFAGVFMIRLNEAGLLSDPDLRWCPSLDQPSATEAALTDLTSVPSLAELHHANVDQLRQIQQFAGGHYAYNLGVMEENRLKSPRFESRASFAILSDAPWLAFRKRPSKGGLSGTTPRVSTFFMRMGGRDFFSFPHWSGCPIIRY